MGNVQANIYEKTSAIRKTKDYSAHNKWIEIVYREQKTQILPFNFSPWQPLPVYGHRLNKSMPCIGFSFA